MFHWAEAEYGLTEKKDKNLRVDGVKKAEQRENLGTLSCSVW